MNRNVTVARWGSEQLADEHHALLQSQTDAAVVGSHSQPEEPPSKKKLAAVIGFFGMLAFFLLVGFLVSLDDDPDPDALSLPGQAIVGGAFSVGAAVCAWLGRGWYESRNFGRLGAIHEVCVESEGLQPLDGREIQIAARSVPTIFDDNSRPQAIGIAKGSWSGCDLIWLEATQIIDGAYIKGPDVNMLTSVIVSKNKRSTACVSDVLVFAERLPEIPDFVVSRRQDPEYGYAQRAFGTSCTVLDLGQKWSKSFLGTAFWGISPDPNANELLPLSEIAERLQDIKWASLHVIGGYMSIQFRPWDKILMSNRPQTAEVMSRNLQFGVDMYRLLKGEQSGDRRDHSA